MSETSEKYPLGATPKTPVVRNEEVARLRLLVIELIEKNEHLRMELHARGILVARPVAQPMSIRADCCLETRPSQDRRPHIFVVDDEFTIAFSLSEVLSGIGYVVAWFCDPREALAFAEKQQPDLLITDINMPYLCGIELACAVRSLWPHCPVLFFSGTLDVERINAELGLSPRIRHREKPSNLTTIISDVRELLALQKGRSDGGAGS